MIAQKSKLDTVTAIAAGLPLTTTTASPSHTPQPSLPSSPDKPLPSSPAEVRSKIYWLGPDGGYGRLPVTTTTPFGAAANNTIWAVGAHGSHTHRPVCVHSALSMPL